MLGSICSIGRLEKDCVSGKETADVFCTKGKWKV